MHPTGSDDLEELHNATTNYSNVLFVKSRTLIQCCYATLNRKAFGFMILKPDLSNFPWREKKMFYLYYYNKEKAIKHDIASNDFELGIF